MIEVNAKVSKTEGGQIRQTSYCLCPFLSDPYNFEVESVGIQTYMS